MPVKGVDEVFALEGIGNQEAVKMPITSTEGVHKITERNEGIEIVWLFAISCG